VGLATPSAVDALARSGVSMRAVKPVEGTTGRIDEWMVSRKAEHPNCAYLWLDYVASPGVQAAAAESLGLAPVNPAACELTRDPNYCEEHHATDDAWWDDVYFRTTPLEDCGDARGAACTNEEEWKTAWATLRQRR
jgi:putative spermidine/putrescine transport system substrate-binding protein